MKVIIRISAIIVIVIIVGIFILPWQTKINTTLDGIQSRIGDINYSENISVTIKGIYRQYLVRKDKFDGTITIDNYEFTYNSSITSAVFYDGFANLCYSDIEGGMFGTLSCNPDFNRILILINEPVGLSKSKSWGGKDGLFISAPSNNRAEAIEIAENLSSNSKWMSKTEWK